MNELMDNGTIKKNGENVFMVDEIELPKKGCFIVNTDVSSGNGIHYIVLYVKNNECFIIDPLGKDNYRPYDNIMSEKLQNYDVQFYPYKFQLNDATNCGYWAIWICKLIKHLKYPSFSVLTNAIVNLVGKSADKNDEMQLVKAFGVQKEYKGEGIIQEAKRYYRGIIMALKGVRTNFKPSMRKFLQKFGDDEIKSLFVVRTPISKGIQTITRKMGNVPFDRLYHLFFVVNGNIVLEKNENINMKNYSPSNEKIAKSINIPNGLTLNIMLGKTLEKIGKENLFRYNAFSNNCQKFVIDVLEQNNIPISDELKKFIFQDVQNIVSNKVEKGVNKITDFVNKIETIIQGEGK